MKNPPSNATIRSMMLPIVNKPLSSTTFSPDWFVLLVTFLFVLFAFSWVEDEPASPPDDESCADVEPSEEDEDELEPEEPAEYEDEPPDDPDCPEEDEPDEDEPDSLDEAEE